MKKQIFIDIVFRITGKVIDTDYGFIPGTCMPFCDDTSCLEECIEGYKMWKTKGGNNYIIHMKKLNSFEESIMIAVTFLLANEEELQIIFRKELEQ